MSASKAVEQIANFRERCALAHRKTLRAFDKAVARERFQPRPITHEEWQAVEAATIRFSDVQRARYPAEMWRLK